jgi:serine/threonine protein kinase
MAVYRKEYVPLRERTRAAGRLLDVFAEEIKDAGAVEIATALIDKVRETGPEFLISHCTLSCLVRHMVLSVTRHVSTISHRLRVRHHHLPPQVNLAVARLDVSRNEIDDTGAIALARAVEVSQSLLYVYLYGNAFQDAGSIAIADALRVNTTVKALDMSQNRVGVAGGAAFGGTLRANATLRDLNLSFAHLGAGGVAALAGGLAVNASITALNLGTNAMGDDGAVALAAAVRVNDSLTALTCINNAIGDLGAAAFADALRFKATGALTSLDLCRNQIADVGAVALVSALQVNGTLTELLLEFNDRVLERGAAALRGALAINIVLRTYSGPGGPLPSAESRRAARPAFLESHCRLLLIDLHTKEGALDVSLRNLEDKKQRLHDATLMLRQISDEADVLARDPCCLAGCRCVNQERYQLAAHLPVSKIPGHLSSVATPGDAAVVARPNEAGLMVGVPVERAAPAAAAATATPAPASTSTPSAFAPLSPGAPVSRRAAPVKPQAAARQPAIDLPGPAPPPAPPAVSALPEAHRIQTSAAANTLNSFRALMAQYASRVMGALNSVYVPSLFATEPVAGVVSTVRPMPTNASSFATALATPHDPLLNADGTGTAAPAFPTEYSLGHPKRVVTQTDRTATTTTTTVTTITTIMQNGANATARPRPSNAVGAPPPTFAFASPLRPYAWWGVRTLNETAQRLTRLCTDFDFSWMTLADFQLRKELGRKYVPAATASSHTRMHGGSAVVFYLAAQRGPAGAPAAWPMTLRIDYNFEQTDSTAQQLSQARFENGVRVNSRANASALPFHPNVLRNLHFFSDRFVDWAHLPENRDVNQFVNIHSKLTMLPTTQLAMHFTLAPSPQFSLRTLIAARAPNTPFPETETLHLATYMAAGLTHLHANLIVHRDLRPENVWLFWPPSESERTQDEMALEMANSNAERAASEQASASSSASSPTAASRAVGASIPLSPFSPHQSASIVARQRTGAGGNAVQAVVAVAGASQTMGAREQQLHAEYASRLLESQPVIAELNEHRDFSKAPAAQRESMTVAYAAKGMSKGGHLGYAPPEIAHATPSDYSVLNYSRADAWSLGVLLYQLMHQSCDRFPYPDTVGIASALQPQAATPAGGKEASSAEPTPSGDDASTPLSPTARQPSTPKRFPSSSGGLLSPTPAGGAASGFGAAATDPIASLTPAALPAWYSPRLREIVCGLLQRDLTKRWHLVQAHAALQSALDNMCTECGHQHSSIVFEP